MRWKLAVFAALLILLVALLPHSLERQKSLGIDYPIFYAASLHQGVAPGYIYPPFLAWVIYPLALLPLDWSIVAWYLLQSAAILAALWIVLPGSVSTRDLRTFAVFLVFVVATFRLVILNAELGQVNGLILLLVLWAVTARSAPLAGALIGIATGIKVSPVLILPFVLVKERSQWKATTLAFVLSLGGCFLLPWASGYSFSGIGALESLTEHASSNIGLSEFVGGGAPAIAVFLLIVSLAVALRARDRREIWLLPFLLMILCPPFLRKAHLLVGMPLGLLLESGRRPLVYAPLAWALGSLGTAFWPPSALLGNAIALVILMADLLSRLGTGEVGSPDQSTSPSA